MKPIIDPRHGDVEDDRASPKRRSLIAIAGSLAAEINLLKLAVAWMLLIGIPGILLGLSPLIVSGWLSMASSKAVTSVAELSSVGLLALILALGMLGGRPLFRLIERSFWSLNSLTVLPSYVLCREGFRYLAERALSAHATQRQHATLRAARAAGAGIVVGALAFGIILVVWPASRWSGSVADLAAPHRLILPALANCIVLVSAYFAIASLIWGIADATMPQPRDLSEFAASPGDGRFWRIAHLSDLHFVGERFGWRIESGRLGPQGNDGIMRALARLDAVHREKPLDAILISGDVTDAGRSAEWAEFLEALAVYPRLAERALIVPGNHDVNIVDRANPARLDLPTSPSKRLRQLRTLSAIAALQGERVRVIDHAAHRLGGTLAETLAPQLSAIACFADTGAVRLSVRLESLWADAFPMILPPDTESGLGIILLNSNAETHFSFTNALGMISVAQVRGIEIAAADYPRASWLVVLHHHLVEYPKRAAAFSERIGTALINGSWFARRLQRLAGRAIVMHGHRHIDWIGWCGGLVIVSAPSPVMGVASEDSAGFHVHTVAIGADGWLRLLAPDRIDVAEPHIVDDAGDALVSTNGSMRPAEPIPPPRTRSAPRG
jgi:predicted phosphodiesterase